MSPWACSQGERSKFARNFGASIRATREDLCSRERWCNACDPLRCASRSSRCTRSSAPVDQIVVIALLGVICGAEGWDELEVFGESNATEIVPDKRMLLRRSGSYSSRREKQCMRSAFGRSFGSSTHVLRPLHRPDPRITMRSP